MSRPAPPSPALVFAVAVGLGACGGGRAAATAPPGPPIVAEPAAVIGTVAEECGALITDLGRLADCQPPRQRERADDLRAWQERAAIDVRGASDPAVAPEDAAATAQACFTARGALAAAIERCP